MTDIHVKRAPISWTVEIRPRDGEKWPVVDDAFQKGFKIQPHALTLTVDEDDLASLGGTPPPPWLDVKSGYRVRANGSVGSRVGQFHTVDTRDLPESVQRAVQIAYSTIMGEAKALGIVK